MELTKSLSKKKEQSGFVILGILKYSMKIIFPRLSSEPEWLAKFFDLLRSILDSMKVNNDKSFDLFRHNVFKSIDSKNFDDVAHLILNYDRGSDDIIVEKRINKKSISIAEMSAFNTESSTKLDNKLEILIKDSASSTRNFQLTSPVSQVVKNDSFCNLKLIHNDQIKFTTLQNKRLPFLSLGVDISLSAAQIKKIFISEMKK